jgi:hypothetical protein
MRSRLALATVLAVLGPAAAGQAATTVGSDLSGQAQFGICGTPCTYFTGDASTGAPVAVAPTDGVIVRWRVKAGSAADGLALRMLRASGAGTYTGVAASETHDLSGPGTATFPARVPVKQGDVVGLDEAGGGKLFAAATTAVYYFASLGTFPKPPTKQPSRELLVNADIEPDADGDGYGDETQDLCPGDETRHATCLSNISISVRPEPAPLTVGRPLSFTIKVANDGPSTAQGVGLVANLPFSATPLQARAGRGFCGGSYTVTCRLGPIERNDSATVVLTVRPEAVGTLVMNAVASTSTDQTSTDDDAFISDVTVLPPTLRLLDLRLSRSVIRVGGRLAIKWFMTDAAAVTVKVEQVTRRGHIRPFGSFPVRGRAGSNVVPFHGRVPRHRRLKPGNYRFTVGATTLDGRVATPGRLSFTVHRRRHS